MQNVGTNGPVSQNQAKVLHKTKVFRLQNKCQCLLYMKLCFIVGTGFLQCL